MAKKTIESTSSEIRAMELVARWRSQGYPASYKKNKISGLYDCQVDMSMSAHYAMTRKRKEGL